MMKLLCFLAVCVLLCVRAHKVELNGFVYEKHENKPLRVSHTPPSTAAIQTSTKLKKQDTPRVKIDTPPVKTPFARTEKLFLRTFDQNTQFVWSDIDSVDVNTGALTKEVQEAYFYQIGFTVDNLGGFDYSTGTFLWASNVVFGQCTEITTPLNGGNVRTNQIAPTVQLMLNGVFDIVSAGAAGGAYVTGEQQGSEVLVEYFSSGPSLTVFPLPAGTQGYANSFDVQSSSIYMLNAVQGKNATQVYTVNLNKSPPSSTQFTFSCGSGSGIPGGPIQSFVVSGGQLYIMLEAFASSTLSYYMVQVDPSTQKCVKYQKLSTTGIVTAGAYSAQLNTIFYAEATNSGTILHKFNPNSWKITNINMGSIAVIDLAVGY